MVAAEEQQKIGPPQPDFIILVAMTARRVIGRQGRLPWHIPEELQLFRELTTGHVVIMGRETFESIGHPLPQRCNIVVSSSLPATPGVTVCPTFTEALRQAESHGRQIFVIGGEQVYRQALPLARTMIVSWIREDYAGDILFPAFDSVAWAVERVEEHAAFSRIWYRRRDPLQPTNGAEGAED